jgi:hypothetical protein
LIHEQEPSYWILYTQLIDKTRKSHTVALV